MEHKYLKWFKVFSSNSIVMFIVYMWNDHKTITLTWKQKKMKMCTDNIYITFLVAIRIVYFSDWRVISILFYWIDRITHSCFCLDALSDLMHQNKGNSSLFLVYFHSMSFPCFSRKKYFTIIDNCNWMLTLSKKILNI